MARVYRCMAMTLACTLLSATALANDWQGAAAAGGELSLSSNLEGHGYALFDALGRELIGGGDLRLHYNTDKVHVGFERIPLVKNKLELFVAMEGEFLIALLLRDYYVGGKRLGQFGFDASYVRADARLQWHPGNYQTIEFNLGGRRWFFDNYSGTAGTFVVPPDTWVFEPRIGYVFWKIDAPGEEWEAHRFFPRVKGIAVGAQFGVDVRSDRSAWGVGGADPRNNPDAVIFTIRQWLRSGVELAPVARLQVEEQASYGWGEDDITRNRVGGSNPYVVPVPGLPWAALVSGRLLSGQASLHFKARAASRHEFGVLVAGGAFNDVRRSGKLDVYGGAGGAGAFADLRFGRWQLHTRLGWAFPVGWLQDGPYFSALGSVGVGFF